MATVTETFVGSVDQATAVTHAFSGVTIAAGKLAVIRAVIMSDTVTFSSVADGASNTWAIATQRNSGASAANQSIMIAYSVLANALSATTVTTTLSATNMFGATLAYFDSDTGWVAQASVLDKTANNEVDPPATAWTSGSTATTTQADELLVGLGSHVNFNGSASTPGSGWTEESDISFTNVTPTPQLVSQWQKVTSTGAYAATGTWGSTEFGPCAIATFKTAAAAAAVIPDIIMAPLR